jgi:hypothetical protein
VVRLAFLLGIVVSLVANMAAAPTLAWKLNLVAEWPPVALLLAVELLAHRSGDAADTASDQSGDEDVDAADPLLARARQVDDRHRELHQRPASAESLRQELRIGAKRSRQLVALLRASRNGNAHS